MDRLGREFIEKRNMVGRVRVDAVTVYTIEGDEYTDEE